MTVPVKLQPEERDLRTLLRRFEQDELIINPQGSPLQRLLRELTNRILEHKE